MGVHLPRGLGGMGERVLDGLGLVEHEHAPLTLHQEAAVARQERIRREDDVPGLELLGAAGAVGPVVDVDGEVGGEPVQLALPVPEHRGRAHDQRRPLHAVGVIEQVGDHLDRLSEAHVVGQERAQPELAGLRQPSQADLLVRAELALKGGGRLHRRDQLRPAQAADQLLELPARVADLHRQAPHLVAPGERGAERRHGGHRRAVQGDGRKGLGAGQRPALERPPLPSDPHERLRRRGERLELLGADLAPAERRPQVVADDAAERERARGEFEIGGVGLEVLLLDQLGRELHGRSGELERRGGQAQLDDPLLAQRHVAVAGACERREDPSRLAQDRLVGGIDVKRPAGVRVGAASSRRRSGASVSSTVRAAAPGRGPGPPPQERLEHPQVDDVGVGLGRAHDPWVAHRRRKGARRGVDEARDRVRRGRSVLASPSSSRMRTACPAAGNAAANRPRSGASPPPEPTARRPGRPAARRAPTRSTARRARSGGGRRRAASRGSASRPCDGCPPPRPPWENRRSVSGRPTSPSRSAQPPGVSGVTE